jgi:hypothetical protein
MGKHSVGEFYRFLENNCLEDTRTRMKAYVGWERVSA